MAVPKYEELMLPTLQCLAAADGPCTTKQIKAYLTNRFELTEEDLAETTSSGNRFNTNANWARCYMKNAGLITRPSYAQFSITEEGRAFAVSHPNGIKKKDLEVFPRFVEWKKSSRRGNGKSLASNEHVAVASIANSDVIEISSEDTPEDVIETQFGLIESKLADELLETVMEMSDYRFESFVVELLLAMGYGTSGEGSPQSRDGGIDGIVHEDRLGFGNIYIQAKHYQRDKSVGVAEVRDFAGALASKSAAKGLFITTGKFSEDARNFVNNFPASKIVLVDGQQLAQLMIEYDFGVTVRKTYELKAIDRDFFDEDA